MASHCTDLPWQSAFSPGAHAENRVQHPMLSQPQTSISTKTAWQPSMASHASSVVASEHVEEHTKPSQVAAHRPMSGVHPGHHVCPAGQTSDPPAPPVPLLPPLGPAPPVPALWPPLAGASPPSDGLPAGSPIPPLPASPAGWPPLAREPPVDEAEPPRFAWPPLAWVEPPCAAPPPCPRPAPPFPAASSSESSVVQAVPSAQIAPPTSTGPLKFRMLR
jgi:hypothetical protein